MADVYTVTFSLIGILISLPALLVAINLLAPTLTGQIETRLDEKLGRSFWLGVPVTAAFALWIAITANIPLGPVRATAAIVAVFGMGLGTVGAAGMARLLAQKIRPLAQPNSELTNLVRGALVYELACLMPIVGWFLFIPFAGITLIGATTATLIRRLRPKPVVVQVAEQQSTTST